MSNLETDLIPEEFFKIMKDFYSDMLSTFPEYENQIKPYLIDLLSEENNKTENIINLFNHCKNIYPERFFDLLYQNKEIFNNEELSLHFLPDIDFKNVWKQDISDKTRLIIWKYLQLVCFCVINNQHDMSSFGDTASLFEAINEDELKRKLEETMEQMSGVFDMSGSGIDVSAMPDLSGINMEDMPNPDELHSHISSLLDGKLGRLASEITEETMRDFQDISGVSSVGDIFKVLFKNPGKLMQMVKKVGGNLDAKIKSGEIKESELMEEAQQLMQKLNKMPGMKNMQKMFGEMGLPMNGKLNMGAMQTKMKHNIGKAKTKERLRRKLEARKQQKIDSKDDQIKLLQQQLAAAKAQNELLAEYGYQQENVKISKSKKKKKKRRKGKKK
jgi:hypothetical protein